nr:integrase, catalytic region, zinc finger, CCHC-type, peptidase aspartic, catalytic [Tanacetum cinerariifolium]
MLAPGNYVQWKSKIKRYIDTKPNHELIHYCLTNPSYELGWKDKEVPTSKGSLITTTERVHETCKNVSAEKIACVANPLARVAQQQPVYHPQTHPTHYTQNSSTRSQQTATRNRGKAIINSSQPIYDQEPSMVDEDDEMSKDKEIDKLMALISLSFKKIYKPTNNNLRTSSNTSRANQDNSPRINRSTGYENQRIGNVAEARETVGSSVVQKSGIQCYNCKEFGHVARDCQKPKRAKDAAYYREKCYCELEAHYMYMAQLQENEVNEIRAERLVRTANPLALIAQQQPAYHPQNHPTHYTQNSSTRSQQAATRNRGKAIVNSPPPIYEQEPSMVAEVDEMSKDKEIDKLMALISLLFKKIYKPTNNNLRTSSNTSRANQDNSLRINKGTGYDNQRIVNVAGARENVARECQKPKRAKDASYHKEKMLLCKQEEAGFQLNAEQADWRDDTDDEPDDQELEAHYMYMAKLQEVTPDDADNSGPIFDTEPLQKVPNNDNYNMFATEIENPEQSKSVNDTYPIEQDGHNVIINSLDMSYDREQIDQDDDDDLANESDLLASLIEKLQCEIDDSKNRNKFLETSNKALVDKLKSKIEDFKTKNKSLESLNNHFKEANNELSKTNKLMYKDLKKSQAELDRHNDVNYTSKVEIDCAKAKGDLMSYKMESEKSFNAYTQKINDLNQMILEMKKEMFAHQETISIMSQQKEAQIRFYKTREDKEIDKVIALENKGVIPTTSVNRPSLKSNPQGDRVMHNNSQGKKQEVEDHIRSVKLSKNKTSVTACNDSLNAKTLNVKSVSAMCDKCVLHDKHDMSVLKYVAKPLKETIISESNKNLRNFTRKLYERVSKTCSWWYPKFTPSGYIWKPKSRKENVNPNLVEIVLFIVDSGCSKHMTGNLKLLINFMEKFLGTVKFGNDQIAPILGYGDLVQGAVTIKRVYYVEGLNHNLFSVSQFCDADLEVVFRKSTCFIRDLKGNDLLT